MSFFFFFSFSFLLPLHLRDTEMGPVGLWNICTITSARSIQSFKLFSVSSLFCFARLFPPLPPRRPLPGSPSFPPPPPTFSLAAQAAAVSQHHDTNKPHPTATTSTSTTTLFQLKYWRTHQSSRMQDYLVAAVNKSIHSKRFYHILNMISTSIMLLVWWK